MCQAKRMKRLKKKSIKEGVATTLYNMQNRSSRSGSIFSRISSITSRRLTRFSWQPQHKAIQISIEEPESEGEQETHVQNKEDSSELPELRDTSIRRSQTWAL